MMAKMYVEGDWYEFSQDEYDKVYEANNAEGLRRLVVSMYGGYTIGDAQRLPKYKLVAMAAALSQMQEQLNTNLQQMESNVLFKSTLYTPLEIKMMQLIIDMYDAIQLQVFCAWDQKSRALKLVNKTKEEYHEFIKGHPDLELEATAES